MSFNGKISSLAVGKVHIAIFLLLWILIPTYYSISIVKNTNVAEFLTKSVKTEIKQEGVIVSFNRNTAATAAGGVNLIYYSLFYLLYLILIYLLSILLPWEVDKSVTTRIMLWSHVPLVTEKIIKIFLLQIMKPVPVETWYAFYNTFLFKEAVRTHPILAILNLSVIFMVLIQFTLCKKYSSSNWKIVVFILFILLISWKLSTFLKVSIYYDY